MPYLKRGVEMGLNFFRRCGFKELDDLSKPIMKCAALAFWTSFVFVAMYSDLLYKRELVDDLGKVLPWFGIFLLAGMYLSQGFLKNDIKFLEKSFDSSFLKIDFLDFVCLGLMAHVAQFILVCLFMQFAWTNCTLSNFYVSVCFYISLALSVLSYYIVKFFVYDHFASKYFA